MKEFAARILRWLQVVRRGAASVYHHTVAALKAILPGWWDLHVYGGIALVTYGIGSVWEPAGYVAFGAMLGGLGLWFHRRVEGE